MTNKITGAKLQNLSSLAQVWENMPIYEIINKGKNKKPTCVILKFYFILNLDDMVPSFG